MASYEDIKKAADENGHWIFRDGNRLEVRSETGIEALFELEPPKLLLLDAQDESECLRHVGIVITGRVLE